MEQGYSKLARQIEQLLDSVISIYQRGCRSFFSKVRADQTVVIANKNVTIRICRMCPTDAVPPTELVFRRFD